MEITEKDKIDAARVSSIIQKVNAINKDYANVVTDEIYKCQPFLISLILGYQVDVKANELDEVAKIIFMIWEYFKDSEKIKLKKISDLQYDNIHTRNVHMLHYFAGENGEGNKSEIVSSALDHIKSKALLTGIYFQFNTQNALVKMDEETRAIITIGMKTLIECFEEIEKS